MIHELMTKVGILRTFKFARKNKIADVPIILEEKNKIVTVGKETYPPWF